MSDLYCLEISVKKVTNIVQFDDTTKLTLRATFHTFPPVVIDSSLPPEKARDSSTSSYIFNCSKYCTFALGDRKVQLQSLSVVLSLLETRRSTPLAFCSVPITVSVTATSRRFSMVPMYDDMHRVVANVEVVAALFRDRQMTDDVRPGGTVTVPLKSATVAKARRDPFPPKGSVLRIIQCDIAFQALSCIEFLESNIRGEFEKLNAIFVDDSEEWLVRLRNAVIQMIRTVNVVVQLFTPNSATQLESSGKRKRAALPTPKQGTVCSYLQLDVYYQLLAMADLVGRLTEQQADPVLTKTAKEVSRCHRHYLRRAKRASADVVRAVNIVFHAVMDERIGRKDLAKEIEYSDGEFESSSSSSSDTESNVPTNDVQWKSTAVQEEVTSI